MGLNEVTTFSPLNQITLQMVCVFFGDAHSVFGTLQTQGNNITGAEPEREAAAVPDTP